MSQGRASKRYRVEVRAPTGQSSTTLPREGRAVRLVVEGRDLRARAAISRDELAVLGHVLGESRAPVAEDAALAVERDQRRDGYRLVDGELRERHARVARPVAERQVLQRALATLVADGAVERVVHEDELERRLLPLRRFRRRRARLDDHPVRHRERAAGLELRHSFDLDEAHAARTDRGPEARLVAEHRNLDPGCLRRLDEARSFRDLDLAVVDGHREQLRHAPPRGRAARCISDGARIPSSDDSPSKGQRPRSMCA